MFQNRWPDDSQRGEVDGKRLGVTSRFRLIVDLKCPASRKPQSCSPDRLFTCRFPKNLFCISDMPTSVPGNRRQLENRHQGTVGDLSTRSSGRESAIITPKPKSRLPFPLRLSHLVFIACLAPKLACSAHALEWDQPIRELDAAPGTKNVKAVFSFHNKGARPVKITSVTSSCGCTTGNLAQDTYAPGTSGQLEMLFEIGDRTGVQEKVLTVTTDEPGEKPVELTLKANIQEYVTLSPRWVVWKTGEEASEKLVTCTASLAQSFTIVSVDSTDPSLTSRIVQSEPGRKFLIYLKPSATTKPVSALVAIRLNIENVGDRVFPVYGYVK